MTAAKSDKKVLFIFTIALLIPEGIEMEEAFLSSSIESEKKLQFAKALEALFSTQLSPLISILYSSY